MLKVSGMYVSPFEVEAALSSHPDVLEAAVVGWNDEQKLIKPKAFVVLKAPDKASDALVRALQEHVKAEAGAVQISALDRVPQGAAEDGDRQDPALQVAGGRTRREVMALADSGFLDIGTQRLEYRMIGPQPDAAPTLVLLHEGLGCVGLWGDFPDKLQAATGAGVLVYSRAGYGQSSPVTLPRPLSYMHDEAREVLPRLLDAIGFQARSADRPQRRRLDCRDLCRQPSGSPRRRPGADRAAFLHRGLAASPRSSRRARPTRPAICARGWRAGTPTSTTPSRAGTAPGSIPISANGISPSSSPISACRC